jgi:hypothetical protein
MTGFIKEMGRELLESIPELVALGLLGSCVFVWYVIWETRVVSW